MKKLFAILISVAMLLSLSACGDEDQPEAATAAPSDTGETAPGQSNSGTVTAVDGNQITLALSDGSEIEFTVTDDTVYTPDMGGMPGEGFGAGGAGDGYAALYIGEGSTWVLTGNSTLTSRSLSGGSSVSNFADFAVEKQ